MELKEIDKTPSVINNFAIIDPPVAVAIEVGFILFLAVVVIIFHVFFLSSYGGQNTLIIPLFSLALGLAGALLSGQNAIGLIKDWRYLLRYKFTIAMMIMVDLGVRVILGGNLAMVFINWSVLIGSASAVNLLFTPLPFLNARNLQNQSNLNYLNPLTLIIVVLLQLGQLWISLLGATLFVMLVQVVARRIMILPITHLIARINYGHEANEKFLANSTLEYWAIYSISDVNGCINESDLLRQTIIGKLILSLPIFGGETMLAGKKSLTRVIDKIFFVEQMLAFSSPTMIINPYSAIGHMAFIRKMLHLNGDPTEINPSLRQRNNCLAQLSAFISNDSASQ